MKRENAVERSSLELGMTKMEPGRLLASESEQFRFSFLKR